jgi:membrane protease YdiL (CAAX protease family)
MSKKITTVESTEGITTEPAIQPKKKGIQVPWNPLIGVLFVVAIYIMSEVAGSVVVLLAAIVPYLQHGAHYANNWATNDIYAQFLFVLIAECFTVGSIYAILQLYKRTFKTIGIRRRPHLKDLLWGFGAVPFYLILYAVMVSVVTALVHGFNPNEKQQIGFNHVHGVLPLIVTAISLVILPPIAEEIMVRGFLYSSLKKGLPKVAAAILTSILFAAAHLSEGGGAGPLWIAALDTFILSLFLIALRECTKNLWSSMTLHATKNGIAYYALYIAPLVHFKIF